MIDVVIAGAGPNGLMLACELALAGIRPVVLERLTGPTTEQRANGLVGQVVRVLDRRGLYERLVQADGPPAPAEGFIFGAFPLDLRGVPKNDVFTVMVPQRRIEAMLTGRAAELGVEILRDHEVVGLEQGEKSVVVHIRGREPIEAAYLVGADGGRSAVRKLAGIGFPGVTTDTSVWLSGHVSVPDGMVAEDGGLIIEGYGKVPPFQHTRTDHGVITWAPGQVPLLNTAEWDRADKPEASLEELAASASRVVGVPVTLGPPAGPGPHLMRRLEGGNTRLAERYREGRVLLLGDAAHVHSAIGGPGLNLGLQDAVNLGWKLAAAVRGEAREGLLDTYESERRPAAERVTMHTQAQSVLIGPGAEVTALRELFGELMTMPSTRKHIADLMAGTDVVYDMGAAEGPLVGRLAPDFPGLRELTRQGRPLVIDPAGNLTPGRFADRVDTVVTGAAPAGMLVRPDGYVAWQGDTTDGLQEALSYWFERP
ncbi:FAD-dependent monooxygenase [Winogradskya humida]|uniref:FAD-dependent oxidoreductase n=1 Tax=Winogradskya humida TaxID=113566 RepID=A0ABQ3ZH49_9ACTN|nr:FAD-dependent monooxygenase [Actinoplanes humidus]GIE17889.1 FAD-dependent oxidoreductase [Actinoplanes humidus]